ncbi:hypothetical protein WOLCODRAFT_102040 [Wolfiporia cocos MD-104 SS10]|uniref:Post-SET domain-containing protein n=1 Tax=Wolfiporia cocos (strain MD-104) TaxID=742152 RepID=A0A2H3JJM0_WOLCO|nr:hypothetical protein WOLCODRAFT_102040 [Wolfiporia cocos MD-104 SS10]
MAENSLHSLTTTLAPAAASLGAIPDATHVPNGQTNGSEAVVVQPIQHPNQNPVDANASQVPQVPQAPLNGVNGAPMIIQPDGTDPQTPVKRKPGRPKGSGKKPVDPNAEPKIKRPVGRPRKDGLPAGSVGPRRASRPRKRPPGTFASGASSASFPYVPAYPGFVPGDPTQAQWRASVSVPPMGSLSTARRLPAQLAFPIDPTLDRDDWSVLARTRPDIFLQTLVSALAAPNPVSAAGPSVEEAFKSHLVSLAPASKNTPTIPTLYSILKTFWLPSSPVYFSLTASATTARTPSDHRFLYWDPQPLVFNGIACPACSAPLINRGRISSGPIKVYDLGKPFFVIGCEYVCKSLGCVAQTTPEGRKFASTDVSILRALPAKLRDEFPAHLLTGAPDLGTGADVWNWHGMGVSIALWNMVRASLRAGLRKEAILDIIKGIQHGLPDYEPPTAQEEEEGANEEEEEEEDTQDAQQVEGDLEYPKDKSNEEYNEAWNANNGVVDANVNTNGNTSGVQDQQAGSSNVIDPNGQANQQQQPPGNPPMQPPQFPQFAQAPYPYGYPPYPYFAGPPPDPNVPNPNLLKRTFSIVDGSPDQALAEPMQKRIRHCCKCGSNECKGKGGRAFCTNPCQDCGKMDCKGRNSKRPDRSCADAWP